VLNLLINTIFCSSCILSILSSILEIRDKDGRNDNVEVILSISIIDVLIFK